MTRSWGPSSCTAEQQVAVPVGHCRCSFAGNGCVWPPSCFLPILFPPAVCWERGDRLQTQPRAVRGLSKGCLTSFCPTSPLSSNCGQWVVHNASWGRHSETQRGSLPSIVLAACSPSTPGGPACWPGEPQGSLPGWQQAPRSCQTKRCGLGWALVLEPGLCTRLSVSFGFHSLCLSQTATQVSSNCSVPKQGVAPLPGSTAHTLGGPAVDAQPGEMKWLVLT